MYECRLSHTHTPIFLLYKSAQVHFHLTTDMCIVLCMHSMWLVSNISHMLEIQSLSYSFIMLFIPTVLYVMFVQRPLFDIVNV